MSILNITVIPADGSEPQVLKFEGQSLTIQGITLQVVPDVVVVTPPVVVPVPLAITSPVSGGASSSTTLSGTSPAGSTVQILDSFVPAVVIVSVPAVPSGLTGIVAGTSIVLSWNQAPSAIGYKVYRNAVALTATAQTATTYIDSTAVAGTTYTFDVSSVGTGGESSLTAPVSVTMPPVVVTGNTTLSINSGGPTVGNFVNDTDFNGGQAFAVANAISVAGVLNAAPATVYQTERFGAASYVIPGLVPSSSCTVRLHFAELFWTAAGQRLFSVVINGTSVLSSFDIFAAAGGEFKAVVKDFPVVADASGKVTVSLMTGASDNPKISALEVIGTFTSAAIPPVTTPPVTIPPVTTPPVTTPPVTSPFTGTYTPGVWADLTPAGLNLTASSGHFGCASFDVDPSNPKTIYICVDQRGLYKTTDGGVTWVLLGDPTKTNTSPTTTSFIDSPINVRVDPKNSSHLILTQGVRGNTIGFWISNDAGLTWTRPAWFAANAPTQDVTTLEVDPADFNHILVGSHSPWTDSTGMYGGGILESHDCGVTFTIHQPPNKVWGFGTIGISFLSDPTLGIGNSNTWLVTTDGQGLWRTADAGTTWTQVSTGLNSSHGGNQIYYAKTGFIYTALFGPVVRSKDNGVTWENLSSAPFGPYYSVCGDGTNLYTCISFTGDNGGHGLQPFITSLETDGVNWTPYNPSAGPQTFADGPFRMMFDKVNSILYAGCWNTGFLALKVK